MATTPNVELRKTKSRLEMMPSDRELAAELATSGDDDDAFGIGARSDAGTDDPDAMVATANTVKSKPKRSHWVGRTVDGYAVTGEFWDPETGDTWLLRKDPKFEREHYLNLSTGVREDAKEVRWEAVYVPEAGVDAQTHDDEEDEEDVGEKFVSKTNGQVYIRYFDNAREAYFYVDEAGETSWDHPDGELEELMLGAGALTPALQALKQQLVSEGPTETKMISREEHTDAKLGKLMLVDEKWMEKHPPARAVPQRPADFTGVYGDADRYWDPDGDTYSVDNNEGSEPGCNEFDDVYSALEELDRYLSAVDMATPDDLLPLNVGKAIYDDILQLVFERTEEEQDFYVAEQRAKRGVTDYRAFTAGKIIGKRTVDLSKAPQLATDISYEKARAAQAAKISRQRLEFKTDESQGTKNVREAVFSRLLFAMDGKLSTDSVTLQRMETFVPTKHKRIDEVVGYQGHQAVSGDESGSLSGVPTAQPQKYTTAGVGATHESDKLTFNASGSSSDSDSDGSRDGAVVAAPSPPKKRSLFSKLFGKGSKSQAKAKDKAELEESGFVAPWERSNSGAIPAPKVSTKELHYSVGNLKLSDYASSD